MLSTVGENVPSISLPRYTWPDVISRVMTWFYGRAVSLRAALCGWLLWGADGVPELRSAT